MSSPARKPEIEFLLKLHAVRRFRPDPVPPDAVRDIVDVARWSGTASNRQNWELVLVRDGALLRDLAKLRGYAHHLAEAPLAAVIVSSGAARDEIQAFDEGRLSERIMLAAMAHGLGSSIGWFVGPGRDEARRLLGAPPESLVRTAISIGYPAEGAERGRRRKPLDEMVHHDRYPAAG